MYRLLNQRKDLLSSQNPDIQPFSISSWILDIETMQIPDFWLISNAGLSVQHYKSAGYPLSGQKVFSQNLVRIVFKYLPGSPALHLIQSPVEGSRTASPDSSTWQLKWIRN